MNTELIKKELKRMQKKLTMAEKCGCEDDIYMAKGAIKELKRLLRLMKGAK